MKTRKRTEAMIHSMTGFARAQGQGNWGAAVCELRSINHRYLDITLRLPDSLYALEAPMRERIREQLHRGKIECFLRYQPGDIGTEITVNQPLAESLCSATRIIEKILPGVAPVNPMDVLRWPGILQIAEVDLETIQDAVLLLLDNGLHDLADARLREGSSLRKNFLQRLEVMQAELERVRQRLPEIYQGQRARLMTRFTEAKVEMDSVRIEQEMVMFAQKIDVTEELERLDTHIGEVRRILKQGGLAGRRLDFLMQELNREANTLGAKSVDVTTTGASVELKVLIEQMREQVQNVE